MSSLYSEDGRQSRMQLQWCETGGLRRLSTSCGGDSKGRLRTGGLRRVATSCSEDGDGENIKSDVQTIVHRHRAHGCDSCSLASSAELSARPAARPLTAYQALNLDVLAQEKRRLISTAPQKEIYVAEAVE